MNQQQADPISIYADYVCPFCYLGYESFDQFCNEREEPLDSTWHPFDLRSQQRQSDGSIDHSVETGKDEEYFEQAKQNVERLAEEYGVEMAQPLAKEVDSYEAQQVALRVREQYPDQFESFHRGVFDALWEEGHDIGEQAVLETIARDAGLPEAFVAETLDDDSSASQLQAAFETARDQRITGVPTFIYGEHAARGAVPPEQLRRLVDDE